MGLRAPCLLVHALVALRGLTCCKARRRPLDLSPVSCTGEGLKSSQIGLQRVWVVSEAGRYPVTTGRGTRRRYPTVRTGHRHAPLSGIDTGDGFMLFTPLVLARVFERANSRSCADTGDGEAEPPNNPIFSFVYIILRIYKSSIEYYTTMTLMYGTGMYTRIRQFIPL